MTVLAHGIGTRTDLPIPVGLALFGAGAAILLTFAVLLLFWRRPRLGDGDSGRPLPAGVQRVLDHAGLRTGLQAVALAAAVLVVVVAFAGPDDTPHNLAPWVLYVTFWVGLVPAGLLLGPVWKIVNPLRLVHRGLSLRIRRAPGAPRVAALGLWPAAGALFVFLWLELVSPHRSDPAVVGAFLVGYAVMQLGLALWFGEGWFAAGDGFEAYSSLIARLSPWGRRGDGRLGCGTRWPAPSARPPARGWPRWSSSCWAPRRSTGCPARCSGRPDRVPRTTPSAAHSGCSR